MTNILADGFLELFLPAAGIRYNCGPTSAAMWIALRQNNGSLDLAANLLAGLWHLDPVSVRSEMDLWLDELRSVGLVCDVLPYENLPGC